MATRLDKHKAILVVMDLARNDHVSISEMEVLMLALDAAPEMIASVRLRMEENDIARRK